MTDASCLSEDEFMLKPVPVSIEDVYVPLKLRKPVEARVVEELAESIIDEGLKVPIQVRRDGNRFVLVAGLHRLAACRLLEQETIDAFIVQARAH